MTTPELKPCPFCAGEAFLHEIPPHKHLLATFMPDHKGSWVIECAGCGIGIINEGKDAVIEAWNRRALDLSTMDAEGVRNADLLEQIYRALSDAGISFKLITSTAPNAPIKFELDKHDGQKAAVNIVQVMDADGRYPSDTQPATTTTTTAAPADNNHAAPQAHDGSHCPRCDSPAPHLHPAMQYGGEVQPCSHPFHEKNTPENARYLVSRPLDAGENAGTQPVEQAGVPREFPHRPAAFINAIADEGNKKEAVEWLQKTWNEACWYREQHDALQRRVERLLDENKELVQMGFEDERNRQKTRADQAEQRAADLQRQLEIERACNKREAFPLPCGHPGWLAHTDDGGKTGFCWQCKCVDLQARLAEAYAAVRDAHDQLGSCIDQVGHPDYSLRELIEHLRQVRDKLYAAIIAASNAAAEKGAK